MQTGPVEGTQPTYFDPRNFSIEAAGAQIIEAILGGRQPAEMTLAALMEPAGKSRRVSSGPSRSQPATMLSLARITMMI